jgi:hypothetical protein
MEGCILDSFGSGLGQVAGFCEHGNKLWTTYNAKDFLNS